MNKPSNSTVESLLSQIDGLASNSDQTFELWVPRNLTLRGQPARGDVAMAIVLDKILGKGYEPDGFDEDEGGRTYKYKISQ
jgi:hypothetical protein